MNSVSQRRQVPIALALEGGGALGAFTWGVLDRLLDEPSLRIAAVSGTSAGAMNAAMLAQGLAEGGAEAAKARLLEFWQRVSIAAGSLPGPLGQWLQSMAGFGPMLEALRKAGGALSAMSGPLSSGFSFRTNPLRGILTELLHPDCFNQPAAPELVIAATRVRTGEARLFRGSEVTVDALLASACLPTLFPAVQIEGEEYWDGGYSSNPPVRALIEAGLPDDVIIVRTSPAQRLTSPHGAVAVKDRLSEITFGSPLRAELNHLARSQSALASVADLPTPLARVRDARLHMIAPINGDIDSAAAAMAPSWPFLTGMRRRGIAVADSWLADNLPHLGERSTLDLSPYADSDTHGLPSHPLQHFLEGSANAP